MKGPRVVVRALLVEEQRLLVNSCSRHLALFGGRVEKGETTRRALERELDEELGLRVEIGRLLYLAENFFVDERQRRIHELGLYYLVRSLRRLGPLVTPRERGLHPSWLAFDAIERSALLPQSLRQRLARDLHPTGALPASTVNLLEVDRVSFPEVL